MTWLVPILNPGPARGFCNSFTNHLYVFEDEHPSGHCNYYLGSPHLEEIEDMDNIRAIYRAQALTQLFTAIQKLSNDILLHFDSNKIYFEHAYFYLKENENLALEELSDPFSNKEIQSLYPYNNIYNDYLDLAANNHLVRNVLFFLYEAFYYPRYFYINIYRINETIENDWPDVKDSRFSYSAKVKEAHTFLNAGNVRGYMNKFIVSGLLSRHGFAQERDITRLQNILTPPPVEETKQQLLVLVNGWLNYKIDNANIKYKRVCMEQN